MSWLDINREKYLGELFPHCRGKENAYLVIKGLSRDSRDLKPGDLFFIIEGKEWDIYKIIPQLEEKVSAFVGEISKKNLIDSLIKKKPIIYVEDVEGCLRRCADIFYGYSSQDFKVIGVTGTNGKTTITYFLYQLLDKLGCRTSLIGSIKYYLGGRVIPALYTTPDYLFLKKAFCVMKEVGTDFVVMEVSSHALEQKRVEGIEFSRCVFTNLSRDHLDYHHNMESYFLAKQRFFLNNPQAIAVINLDDSWGRRLLTVVQRVITYGIEEESTFRAGEIAFFQKETSFCIFWENRGWRVSLPFLGKYNVYNCLAVLATLSSLGFDPENISQFFSQLKLPPGRMEEVVSGVFVDYAHTPDALRNALLALREAGYKKIICVFGCGGERDRGKRKIMGSIASSLAEYSFITSDNPRREAPLQICNQIREGFLKKNYNIVLDRREAIERGFRLKHESKDCALLIAGKGHEDYQIVGEEKFPFQDQRVVRDLSRERVVHE